MNGSLHFGTLGPLEVSVEGRAVDLGRPKQRAVLAALLVNANHVVSLDRFADVLWPGGAAQSTGSLPVYIANLRRLVEPDRPARTPPERILTQRPGYLLRVAPGEYDAADFEALAAAGNRHLAAGRPRAARRALGEALALWRGPALDEFPFAELEADRLEALRVAAIEDRVDADLRLGAHTAVVAELESLVQKHGLRERLVALLMVALYRSGRQGEALRAYTTARRLLAEELGLDPGPELRRLEAAILAQLPELDWRTPPAEGVAAEVRPEPQAPAVAPPDPFFGRAAELAALEQAVARLGAGGAGTVMVSGEAGIGKTRLVQEAVARAEAAGATVVWGRCEEGDGAPPFWPWIQVLRALLAGPDVDAVRGAVGPSAPELAQIVPEVKEVAGDVGAPPAMDPAGARHRFFVAVADFLDRLSAARALVVVLDDLHWADAPSLQLLTHLVKRVPRTRTLLVGAYRDVDPAPDERLTETLATLARQPDRLVLSLQGLTRDEVAEFMGHEAGAEAPAGAVAVVWARAAGNPFFVGELTRLLVAEHGLTASAASTVAVPWAVRQVIGRRLARLPGGTRDLLTMAAVAGQDFDLRVVARAAGSDLGDALDLVDVAVAAGVLRAHPDAVERFAFSHALVQETVYEEATPLRRARLHGLVAAALEEVGGDQAPATEVAHHRYAAVALTGPGPAIAAALRASAASQAALAHEVAEEHLRRALDLVASLPAGAARDARELDVQDQLAALLTLVKGVAVPETAAAWSRATELCRLLDDRRRLLPSLWGLLSFAWANGDLAGARTLGEHLLRLGEASSEDVVTAAARLGLGSVALCAGEVEEGASQLAAGKELADAVPDHLLADVTYADLRVQVDSWLAMARHLQGRHDEGRRLLAGVLARAGAIGGPFTVAIALAFALFGRVLGDDVPEARQVADELLEHSRTYQLADFALHAGIVRAWTVARDKAPPPDLAATLELLRVGAAGIRPWRPFWGGLAGDAWRWLDRLDEAGRAVEDALDEVEGMGSSFCGAELLRLRAEIRLAAAPAQGPEAQARLEAAARADLEEAARQAARQGAVLYADRVAGPLGRLGRRPPPDDAPPTEPD